MTKPPPNPEGKIKAAGRWWEPHEIFLFQRDWNDPEMTRKSTCRKYGIIWDSLRCNPRARKILGIDAFDKRHGGGMVTAGCRNVPKNAHPFAKHVFWALNNQQRTIKDTAEEVGIGRHVISDWAYRTPNLVLLESVLNHLGYKLAIVPEDTDVAMLSRRAA